MDPAGSPTQALPDDARTWRRALIGGVPLAMAILVFELTADPSLVVVVGCSRFGWEHLGAAFWLRRWDPDPGRRRAGFWFVLAWGLLRICLVAMVLMFSIALLLQVVGLGLGRRPVAGVPIQFVIASLLAIAGLVLIALASGAGVAAALRGGVKVWVGPEILEARRARSWPPRFPRNRWSHENRARLTLLVATAGWGLVALIVGVIAGFFVLRLGGPGGLAPAESIQVVMVLTLVLLVAFLRGSWVVRRRVLARKPFECWPADEPARDLLDPRFADFA